MAYISRTQTAGNQKTFTLSFWVKRANVTDEQCFFSISNGGSYMQLKFNSDKYLEYNDGPSTIRFITSRKFRDPSAWYHIVIKYDSTESVEADRFKMFINGTQETSFGTATYPGLNTDSQININTGVLRIGVDQSTTGTYYGEMSWVQLVDGTALDATSFGSVDSTSGIWKIKPSAYGTPGTNGFCLAMEDRSNLDLDTSSNAFTFTTTGTLTPTTDNPSNNFCTMNSNVANRSGFTWSNGNNKVTTAGSAGSGATMGVMGGKWYYEIYIDTLGNIYGGWQDLSNLEADLNEFVPRGAVCMNNTPDIYYNGSGSAVSSGYKGVSSLAASGYYGFAFDVPNLKCWWSENGQWYTANSGTASTLTRAEVTSNTSGFDCTTASTMSSSSIIGPFMGCSTSATTNSFNFGNGVFGTTALTGTTYTDDNDQGVFKYEPPDGFRALCTKNIKAYGG